MPVSGRISDSLGNLFGLAVAMWQEKSSEADVVNAPVPPNHQNETNKSEPGLDPIRHVHLSRFQQADRMKPH